MKSARPRVFKTLVINISLLATFLSGCTHSSSGSSQSCAAGNNVIQVSVDGSLCGTGVYVNEPCTAVTICQVGTTNCQTIGNILIDTGSYGLRIFSSAVNSSLLSALSIVQASSPSGNLAECASFGSTGSVKLWGSVRSTDVVLGGESPATASVQFIDSTYVGEAANCSGAVSSASSVGYNGILGVGLATQDCGSNCAGASPAKIYFSCNGSTCSGTSGTTGAQVTLANQVTNPVYLQGKDNNGVILQLPGIGSSGALSEAGCLILGIGTESNNSASGLTAFAANASGDFVTTLGGTNYTSFLDSGSNGYFVPASAVGNPTQSGSWFAPSSTLNFTATNIGNGGSPTQSFTLQIANANSLFSTGNAVFNNLSGPIVGSVVDLGLPFFFGRNVVVGFSGMSSSLGTGPYWAY